MIRNQLVGPLSLLGGPREGGGGGNENYVVVPYVIVPYEGQKIEKNIDRKRGG